jgi:hypothetical protein
MVTPFAALVLSFTLAQPGGSGTAMPPWQPQATSGTATAAPAVVPPAPAATTASPAPATTSAPAVAPAPAPGPAAAPAPEGPPPDSQPVLRAAPGNWGMTFIFGGFAPLSVAGLGDLPLPSGLLFTEIGVRRVFKRVVIPFSFGAGVAQTRQDGQSPVYAAGVSASVAVLKGFRVWRRIAPYYGAFIHTHYIDARGPDNWLVNLTIGPILGIEYFIADRVSLYGQGIFGFGPEFTKGKVDFTARATMAAGGQLGLTFYF